MALLFLFLPKMYEYSLESLQWGNSSEYQQHTIEPDKRGYLGPVVQIVVSLTSSLRVISLTVLADSIHNILIFFAEKM